MRGIILAGGNGTRMYPTTKAISKQLLSVYDKPMIYYPLSILLNSGIKEILIISTPDDLPIYKKLLGKGDDLGVKLDYAEQIKPEGLAQAFIIAEDFIGSEDVCMILGDNIFYGDGLEDLLKTTVKKVTELKKATIFGYLVNDPKRYGIINFNDNNEIISIEEKPVKPKSNYAIIGLYFYPNSVVKLSKQISPSQRGEMEITSINNLYLENNELHVEILSTGYTWFDTGTPDSLLEASNFIQTIEKSHGKKVACIEEIVYKNGYISLNQLKKLSKKISGSKYGQYLSILTAS